MIILEILNGQHSGVKTRLDSLPARIGGALNNDVVIRDLGEDSFTLSEGKLGNLVVASETLTITIDDGVQGLDPKTIILPPVTLGVADLVNLRITSINPITPTHFKIKQWADAAPFEIPTPVIETVAGAASRLFGPDIQNRDLIMGAAFIPVFLTLMLISFGDLTASVVRPTFPNNVNSMKKVNMDQKQTECPDCTKEAAAFLEGLLKEANIRGVMVSQEKDLLRVTGEILESQDQIWNEVHQKYDFTWNAQIPADINLTQIKSEAPFEIRSVWLGADREFTTEDGATFKVGDQTDNGWHVETIESSKITLARKSSKLELKF